MNDLADTLHHVMAKRNLTLQQVADDSNLPIETLRNIYYEKSHDPKVSTVLKLSQALDLSVNYLCGHHLYKEDEEILIRNYRAASNRGKAVIKLFAQIESNMTASERDSDKYIIPCLIPMGIITDGLEYHSCNAIKIETQYPHAYLAIEITTNNFAPLYCKGDRILLENRFPSNTECAVFMSKGKAYLRQYFEKDNGYCLHCLNNRGVDMNFDRMDAVDCIGTLIGIIRT